ncbi:unnamed protein product, partial [Prorocentrum cordatum]
DARAAKHRKVAQNMARVAELAYGASKITQTLPMLAYIQVKADVTSHMEEISDRVYSVSDCVTHGKSCIAEVAGNARPLSRSDSRASGPPPASPSPTEVTEEDESAKRRRHSRSPSGKSETFPEATSGASSSGGASASGVNVLLGAPAPAVTDDVKEAGELPANPRQRLVPADGPTEAPACAGGATGAIPPPQAGNPSPAEAPITKEPIARSETHAIL